MSWTSGAPARSVALLATFVIAFGCSRSGENARKNYEPAFPSVENTGPFASREEGSEAFTFAADRKSTRLNSSHQ